MPRLMAEILDIVAPPTSTREGAPRSVRARVRVTGAAPKGLPIPETVIGREGEVTRHVLFDWELTAGAVILLSIEESRGILRPEGPEDPPPSPPGACALRVEADLNQDGFPEQILENAFVRAVVSPHHGGRLAGLTVRGSGVQLLTPTSELAGSYADLGGVEDRLGDDAGELWKQRFAVTETSADGAPGAFARLRAQPDSHKGLSIAKSVALDPDLPAVRLETAFHYAGKGEPPAAAPPTGPAPEKDQLDLDYTARALFLPAHAGEAPSPDSRIRIDLPLATRVESLRYHAGLWCYPYSGLPLGAVLLDDEATGSALLMLTDPATLGNVDLNLEGCGLEVRLRMLHEKLDADRQRTFGLLLAAGCAAAATPRIAAVASIGALDATGHRALCVVARHAQARGGFVYFPQGDEEGRHDLVPRGWPGIGEILVCQMALGDFVPSHLRLEIDRDELVLPLREGVAP